MRRKLLLIPLLFAAMPAADAQQRRLPSEQRCGWLVNPTPGNFWLVDRQGQWLIGVQGGYQAPGMDETPDFTTRGWIRTNGNYGYGCACMRVSTDRRTQRITSIHSARSVPLAQCRSDSNLPRRP